MIDWSAVKAAYVTSDKSYSQLAQEFGASESQVAYHARREGWADLRAEHGSTEDPYEKLNRASRLLDGCVLRLLESTQEVTSKEAAELARTVKTALEIRRELQEQQKRQDAANITVKFERPEWAE